MSLAMSIVRAARRNPSDSMGTTSKKKTLDAAGDDHDRLLTTSDVARLYGVSDETVRRWIRKGVIPFTQVGPYRSKRIRLSDAKQLMTEVRPA
jgi:excisionase family DNA binding protein